MIETYKIITGKYDIEAIPTLQLKEQTRISQQEDICINWQKTEALQKLENISLPIELLNHGITCQKTLSQPPP